MRSGVHATDDVASRPLAIPVGNVTIQADLRLPTQATGLILFAHGSGSSRFSPRNRHVAQRLVEAGLGTVLADLLTPDEEAVDEHTRQHRFDIGLLAQRLATATDWLVTQDDTGHLPIGYFGASTGAGGALVAAALHPGLVRAVVSRGGRPDLAGEALEYVRVPTLLLVGGQDVPVIELNRQALERLTCEKALVIVPNATHLFEEPGALDTVADHAREWFLGHLPAPGR